MPASVPFLFTSMKVAVAASLVGAIVGELPTGAVAGIGAKLLAGSYYSQTIDIWAALVAGSVVAALLVVIVGIVGAHRRSRRWGRGRHELARSSSWQAVLAIVALRGRMCAWRAAAPKVPMRWRSPRRTSTIPMLATTRLIFGCCSSRPRLDGRSAGLVEAVRAVHRRASRRLAADSAASPASKARRVRRTSCCSRAAWLLAWLCVARAVRAAADRPSRPAWRCGC